MKYIKKKRVFERIVQKSSKVIVSALLLSVIGIQSSHVLARSIVDETVDNSIKHETRNEQTQVQYKELDQYLQDTVSKLHIPGLAIGVTNKEEILFSSTYGTCDSVDDPFILGSLSKPITAMAIMQLVDQGLIDLENDITCYLDDMEFERKITVNQLLNHTSGLGTYDNLVRYRVTNQYGKFSFANVNYMLLGKIIEKVTKQSYEEYIQKTIFEPYQMKSSAASIKQSNVNGLLPGYSNFFGVPIQTKGKRPKDGHCFSYPSGYLSSSVTDLSTFIQIYLQNDALNSKAKLDFLQSMQLVDEKSQEFYANGFYISSKSQEIMHVTGLVENYMSYMSILPQEELGVVLLWNMNDYFVSNEAMKSVCESINQLLGGEKIDPISSTTYVVKHGFIDLVCICLLVIAIHPVLRIRKYQGNQSRTKDQTMMELAYHAALPTALLMGPMLFGLPMWYMRDYMMDVWIIWMVSILLLYTGGILKMQKRKKYHQKTGEQVNTKQLKSMRFVGKKKM